MRQVFGRIFHDTSRRVGGKIVPRLRAVTPQAPWKERLKAIVDEVQSKGKCVINVHGAPKTTRSRMHPYRHLAADWRRAIDEGYLKQGRYTPMQVPVVREKHWWPRSLGYHSYVEYTGKPL